MTGLERIQAALNGQRSDRLPVLPILHSGLPFILSTPLSDYFSSAKCMSDVIIQGYQTFEYDGVQLSLGVTGEAQALGAELYQPHDAGPVLKQRLLAGIFTGKVNLTEAVDKLRCINPAQQGRMPLYYEAVLRTMDRIGQHAFVMSLLRGPLLAASQLCGVEPLLIAMIESPDQVKTVLEFTTEIAVQLAGWLLNSGAHGLMLGEATCSPNFISPQLYRSLVLPYHQRLVSECKNLGWNTIGMHICGRITPIFQDIISTGVNIVDVDYQVPADTAIQLAAHKVCLRGNLDPSSVFRFGTPEHIQEETDRLIELVRNQKNWILSSGCDIPPGTPAVNIHTFIESVRSQ
jgi:uroporphyrinogen decarboxylase